MTRIACDARALIGPQTGVGTWTEQVMGGLAGIAGNQLLLASPKPLVRPPLLEGDTVQVLAPPRLPIPGTIWLHSLLGRQLREAGAEVWVSSLAVVPRRCPVPAVAMVHDITPRTHPHRHTLRNRFCFNAYLEESLERAVVVVVGSQATRQAVEEHFPRMRSRLVQIGYGVDRFFSPAAPEDDGSDVRTRFSAGCPYLLHLGTLEPRKGLLTLVAAWEQLRRLVSEPPYLVLAGKPGWDVGQLQQRIARSPYREHIHLSGYVERQDARSLLRHAAVVVLPSEAEGFGLPLAEAISCGAACVASDIPPFREVAAGAALHCPPGDAAALARSLADALDPATRSRLHSAALARADHLRWEPVVEQWQQLIEDVVHNRL